jgi:hypothetical protein
MLAVVRHKSGAVANGCPFSFSTINFAVASGKGNKIFNQKLHVQTVNKPRLPWSKTIT